MTDRKSAAGTGPDRASVPAPAGAGGVPADAALNGTRSNASSAPSLGDDGRFLHRCQHPGCTRWGCFGSGVDLRRGRLGRWFCAEHRRGAAASAAAEGGETLDRGGQSRLF